MRKRRMVGTAGHIDHGKTALVRALTGIDCDRLPEEKRRGITIDLGFASFLTEELQIGLVDVPGHERFVKNMLAGVGGIDAALLVVAADESLKPQTREHFAICELLQIPTGVVAITKKDLVEDDILGIVRLEIEELVRGSFLERKPIVPVSSITGEGIPQLTAALIEVLTSISDRDATKKVFRLPIDRVFTMKGFGCVVTGTTVSGTLQVDSEVEILPPGRRTRARHIQVHGEPRSSAAAGERTSVNLPDVQVDQLQRGDQLVAPGFLRPTQVVTAELELLEDAEPLKDQSRVRFHHYSAELIGSVRILDAETRRRGDAESSKRAVVFPGEHAYVQISLERPVVAVAGDRFVIRRYSPQTTVGGGTIIDPHLGKLRGTRRDALQTLAHASFQDRVVLLAQLAGLRGISTGELMMRTGVLPQHLPPVDSTDLVRVGDRWIHGHHIEALRRRVMEFLMEYFKAKPMSLGVPKSELLQKLFPPDADTVLTSFLLEDLARQQIVTVEGDLLQVPGRSRELRGAEGELARAIEARFREAGLQSPPVSELIQSIAQKPKVIEGVVGYLVKTGALVRLSEGIYVHKDPLLEARQRIASHRGTSVDVGWFKDLFGLSRKIVIPLLEYFDRVGATRRVGDRREIL